MKTPSMAGARQRGIALIVALIFLLILTVLGVTAAMNNSLQERMAGNSRDRDLAFQAAEHAVDQAAGFLSSKTTAELDDLVDINAVSPAPCDKVADDGIRCFNTASPPPNDANYWRNTFNWASSDLVDVADLPTANQLDKVANQPRYLIEQMPSYTDTSVTPPVTYRYYRVTARGTGGSDEAAVVLQTMYRIEE
jgi:type IV pilus assembly protein PilX